MTEANQFITFLNKVEPLLLVIIPAIVAIWMKVRARAKQESDALKSAQLNKQQDRYNTWAHDESRRIILKIKELCNVYKDRSRADQVLYMQLENGTAGTSKIYNMFLSCLAEDNRYGELPKRLTELQRIPYSQAAEWAEEVSKSVLAVQDIKTKESCICPVTKNATSHISAPVIDKDGYLIGIVVFNYRAVAFNGTDEAQQIALIKDFKTAVETVFLSYRVLQQEKMKELRMLEDKKDDHRTFGV